MRSIVLVWYWAGACTGSAVVNRDYGEGVAHVTCGPADGPAIRMVLSDSSPPFEPHAVPAGPFLELTVNSAADRASGRTFPIEPEGRGREGTAFARSCQSSAECEVGSAGWVRVIAMRRTDGQSLVEGSYRLTFPGRSTIGGRFEVRWLEHAPLCG